MYKVLLADDHTILLDGLKALVNAMDGFKVAATATEVKAAAALLRRQRFDLLIADYALPDGDGLQLVALIQQASLPTRSLILSMHEDVELVRKSLDAGANGYLLKKDSHDDLQYAMRKVMQEGQYVSDVLMKAVLSRQPEAQAPRLTRREQQVLNLVLQELTSREIAAQLFISERTVETHRKNIWRKSGAKTMIGLLKQAQKHGWIQEKD